MGGCLVSLWSLSSTPSPPVPDRFSSSSHPGETCLNLLYSSYFGPDFRFGLDRFSISYIRWHRSSTIVAPFRFLLRNATGWQYSANANARCITFNFKRLEEVRKTHDLSISHLRLDNLKGARGGTGPDKVTFRHKGHVVLNPLMRRR